MTETWQVYPSIIPLYVVGISLLAVPLIVLSNNRPNLREFWTLGASIVKFLLVFSLLPNLLSHRIALFTLWEIAPGITLTLKADAMGVFFALVASSLWIATSLYSIGYMRGLKEHKQTRYFASFAVCLSATMGIAFAANILTFLIFYEILTVATYPLVIHKETKEAISAGRKYLAYTLSAGILLIAATVLTYKLTGNLDFKAGGIFDPTSLPRQRAWILFLLFLGGVGVKAAIMPLHSWLPAAMIAPTPVSALLHAVAVVKSGAFGVLRLVGFIFGPTLMHLYGLDILLATLACLTIITASLLAFRQDNLKHRLAYSTVGHLSYIVLGAALLSPAAFAGALLHLLNHAFLKITLFFCAGAIYVTMHKEKISELKGVGHAMPWTMGAFTIATIGLMGVPPLNGFISKWEICLGSLQAGTFLPLIILIISGLLNGGYLFPIIYKAYYTGTPHPIKEKEPYIMVVPLLVTISFAVLLGLFPNGVFTFFDLATGVGKEILRGFVR